MADTTRRADALDALRGLAILLMILSGSIHFPNHLPAWMYHAQVPPPDFKFIPTLPGITWVDLVFPFFLFAMGAAFPFALSKKLDAGIPQWKIILQIVQRGVLLAGFAIYIQHVKPFALHPEPTTVDWFIGLLGFALLFPMLLRLPQTVKPAIRYTVKLAGYAGAAILLALLTYPNGTGFSVGRSDIIILVLANVAVFGSLIWLWTRNYVMLRLGLLGFFLAFRLTQNIDGSWNHWLWTASPFPWLYTLYYLQYLFIVLPGTVVGDLIYTWMNSSSSGQTETAHFSKQKMLGAFILMIGFLLVNLIGLFSRLLVPTLFANIGCCLIGLTLFSNPGNSLERLFRTLFQWGVYWLLLGLCFEAFEGGIKKDKATLSYYFVTNGLAIFSYIAFSILTDMFKKRKYVALLIESGQNPMIAYIGASNVVLPILGLTTLSSLLSMLTCTPWLGFIKGVIITLLVALLAGFCTRKKLFWRT
jgi:predicted acyltransferase